MQNYYNKCIGDESPGSFYSCFLPVSNYLRYKLSYYLSVIIQCTHCQHNQYKLNDEPFGGHVMAGMSTINI